MNLIRQLLLACAATLLATVGAPAQTTNISGVVRGTNGQPAPGVSVQIIGACGSRERITVRTDSAGKFELENPQRRAKTVLTQYLLARDEEHDLAALQYIDEDATRLDLALAPALTLAGRAECEGKPVTNASATLAFLIGELVINLPGLDRSTGVPGEFEIRAIPVGRRYGLFVSAPDCGAKGVGTIHESEPGRVELGPVPLKPAKLKLAGQVLDFQGLPVADCNVHLLGRGQPPSVTFTDGGGRFLFDRVCEGAAQVSVTDGIFSGLASAAGGASNVLITLRAPMGVVARPPPREPLKGRALPDLAAFHLPAGAIPPGKAALICLFDAGQRSSRHVLHLLDERASGLRQQNLCVIAIQSPIIGDDVFNQWKTAAPVSFPVGRVTQESKQTQWALDAPASPWFILADASRDIIAEGFSLDDLDAQLQKLRKPGLNEISSRRD